MKHILHVKPDFEKNESIIQLATNCNVHPTYTLQNVKRFLRIISFNRTFIKNIGATSPLVLYAKLD